MATKNQKSDWVSNLQQLINKLIDLRGQFLTLKDQYDSQDLGNQITIEEFIEFTGGAEKTDLPNLIALLDKQLQFGGSGELTTLFNLKK